MDCCLFIKKVGFGVGGIVVGFVLVVLVIV